MSMLLLNLLALVATATGAALFYLGSGRQVALARRLDPRASLGWGLTLLLAAWLMWCAALHPAAAFFVTVTLTMGWLTALPVGVVLLKPRRAA
ncbi:MAG: hypothetical protein HYU59_02430 [Magnetospirillum gryphiswaldense]|nr:hypothetical protein [Magnetospirillum gryphiswaldense]